MGRSILTCKYITQTSVLCIPPSDARNNDYNAHLDLSLSPRFEMSWIRVQFQAWVASYERMEMPSEHFVPSAASKSYQSKGASDTAARHKQCPFNLPEWSVSTSALMFMLGRWSSTLRAAGKTVAKGIMSALVWTFVPTCSLEWCLCFERSHRGCPADEPFQGKPVVITNRHLVLDSFLGVLPPTFKKEFERNVWAHVISNDKELDANLHPQYDDDKQWA